MRKSNDGFTLIELLVGILCATLITGAALSVLLMGARTNHALHDANSEQQTARIITTLVEKLATEGSICSVEVRGELENSGYDPGYRNWELLDDTDSPILSYSFSDQTIYSADGTPIMEGVTASTLTLSESPLSGCLLGFSMKTDDGYYQTAVYCRSSKIATDSILLDKNGVSAEVSKDDYTTEEIEPDLDYSDSREGRFKLLEVLCTQYGSTGEIKGSTSDKEYNQYFSAWFLKHKHGSDSYQAYNSTYVTDPDHYWSTNTPWCACFLSWGFGQVREYLDYQTTEDMPYFANVDSGQTLYFNGDSWYSPGERLPTPGDLIFFDWYESADSNLEHVGAVFYADSTYVYTIEGNNSGRVELNRYKLNDSRIAGYGVLNWKTTAET